MANVNFKKGSFLVQLAVCITRKRMKRSLHPFNSLSDPPYHAKLLIQTRESGKRLIEAGCEINGNAKVNVHVFRRNEEMR